MTLKELDELSRVEVGVSEFDDLKNIDEIAIENSLDANQRVLDFIEKMGNPYCFYCGEILVRINFDSTGIDLRTRLLNYFAGLK